MDQATSQRFKYWQTRTIIATMIGYALFYFVRKNLSIAMPAMQADLGITKTELGLFLTLHGLIYGLSKFINGFIGDRVNALSLHRGRVGCNCMRVCGLAGLEVELFRTFHYRSAGCGRCVVYHERYPAAGWATDRFFGGRSPRVCVFCMGFATLFIFLFWLLDTPPMWFASLLLMAAGFFIYGPQALVGIAAANMATKRAAATAGGFTGLFGYASTLVSGWGLGYLATNYGWSLAISVLIGIGITGTLVFMLAWNAKADGYGTK